VQRYQFIFERKYPIQIIVMYRKDLTAKATYSFSDVLISLFESGRHPVTEQLQKILKSNVHEGIAERESILNKAPKICF